MEIKKSNKANIDKNIGMYILVGLCLALGVSWMGLEYKKFDPIIEKTVEKTATKHDLELVEISRQDLTPPEPPRQEINRTTQIEITDEEVEEDFELFDFEDDDLSDIDDYAGQDDGQDDVFEAEVYRIVQEMPEFPGGEVALFEFIRENTVYPAIAKNANITGMIYISFVVEPDGSITNVTQAEGSENIGGGCLEESKRVVELMPKWKPGKQRGNAVRVSYVLPMEYNLSGGN